MKAIKIPYRYKAYKKLWIDEVLQLDDINQGITLCRKLGWACSKIIVGKEEQKEIAGLACSSSPKWGIELLEEFSNLEIIRSKKQSELVFVCDKEFK